MIINLSNHPSIKWDEKQLKEARIYGDIVDMPFPQISPTSTSEEVDKIVNGYYAKIVELAPIAVMVQGEFIFTYRLVHLLKNNGIMVLASRTERKVKETVENGITKKISEFNFAGFMEY